MAQPFSQPAPSSQTRDGFKLLRGYVVLRTPTAEDLAAAALWANLHACLRTVPVRRWHWEPDRALRARHLRVKDPARRRWFPFVPDGYFEIEYHPPVAVAGQPPLRGTSRRAAVQGP